MSSENKTPVDVAEEQSAAAWEKADDAVTDLEHMSADFRETQETQETQE